MNITNKLNLPQPFVQAVLNDPYSPGDCDITVTKLISPPRKVALEKKYHKEIKEDVADRLWALFGQAVHNILERAEAEAVTEERLYLDRQGWRIGGKFDRLLLEEGLLQEYKVTSVYSVKNGHKKEWEAQLNMLAHILRENGNKINKIEAVALLRDWSGGKAEKNSDYPESQVVVLGIELWSEERCEEYIDERIRLHQLARVKLPECSLEERWAKPDQWALIKKGGKRARKIYFDYREAAEALELAGVNYELDHRVGSSLRCESYCSVSKFCEKLKSIHKQKNVA